MTEPGAGTELIQQHVATAKTGEAVDLGDFSQVAAQYSTVQYNTIQYSTVQYSTVQYSTVQYSNGAASPGRGAVVVDAELAVALARGQGTLLVSPLAAAL